MTAITTFTSVLVNKLQDSPGECFKVSTRYTLLSLG